ncbi:LysR family transcriptional regulator [Paraburkholderia bonniea]|uniref:LysR family transcriptional regulator n=1 Tax=Paraburkholderia bonniea TaxID=2152891 RepID=UPI00129154C1|nr:LysR family transcriptional regulator [Paraburkholderia bonniea]WJF90964.1 LysR family transcriptional regulator [Paraburkholderia bonniea]WJF94278.1 LysR family transcriptional regulator [Paraburkholderia bonniea]
MIRSPLELRHLQTLLALRDTGNLSRAAQLLCLTQSALSHQLKALEAHFGMPLFVRKSAPLSFTPGGKRLLTLAAEVVPAIEAAERDVARLALGTGGMLRIAVECHTCFDWLMPAMDVFRQRWPEVELDIVSGFHADPIGLLHQDRADLAIVAEADPDEAVTYHPLFRFQIVGLVGNDHALAHEAALTAEHFRDETLITYPVPDDMLDIVRQVLKPAGIEPRRRTSELTVAILQLVASRRGIAALPLWAVSTYLDKHYVSARPVLTASNTALAGELYAATLPAFAKRPYAVDFVSTMRETSVLTLPQIELL